MLDHCPSGIVATDVNAFRMCSLNVSQSCLGSAHQPVRRVS